MDAMNKLDIIYLLRLEDSEQLSWSWSWILPQKFHAKRKTHKRNLCLPKGFEIECVQIHEIDEHAASQADQRGVDGHILHCINHDNQKCYEGEPHK
jgi:hypothetical protein